MMKLLYFRHEWNDVEFFMTESKCETIVFVSRSYTAAGNSNENNNKVKGNDENFLYICEIGEF